MTDPRPLIIHVVYSFDVGGLENGIVNLLNNMPAEHFRHKIVALNHCVPSFCERVRCHDVEFVSLHKPPGHGMKLYPALFRMFRDEKPTIVHTRNLAALEMVVPAWLAGVPVRIHGEHGWDSFDREGTSRKYRFVRKLYSPFVSRYVALSRKIESYLFDKVGVAPRRVKRICNGVDARRFAPVATRGSLPGSPFGAPELMVFGAVGRLQAVKDHANLIRAFAQMIRGDGEAAQRARLMIVGGGPLHGELDALVRSEGLEAHVWLTGERSDIPDAMAAMDVFVMPSLSEGISNTVLEAMASGLPVIATDVGGNPELVVDGHSGLLVPAANPAALAEAMTTLFRAPGQVRAMGQAGRERVLQAFSLDAMVGSYLSLYQEQLPERSGASAAAVETRKSPSLKA